ncbi:unnamed protein product [Clonostachys byssicola]|uniref:SRR1-like domain-containing protein n=1 Tax=Clonostachys byssicola TaxID=160290 RepID=A0A9N9Y8U7_9HYPO|nr:unnamed protein product [Clonostachys byssicola]
MSLEKAEADDGWTHVKSKSRRRPGKKSPKAVHTVQENQIHAVQTENTRSPEEIASEYQRIRSEFEVTKAGEELHELMTKNGPKDVSQAVCLGIGTFDPPDGGWETKRRTFIQLIGFLLMVEALEKRDKTKVKCYFQDPVFGEADKAFIVSLGHDVVSSPEGFEKVDGNTLLSGVHLYRPIYAKALEKCLPAVFIGTDLDVWDTVTLGTMDDLAMAKTMEETYSKKKHPQDPMSTAFTNTTIYWRPQLAVATLSTLEKEPTESQTPTETTSENDKS